MLSLLVAVMTSARLSILPSLLFLVLGALLLLGPAPTARACVKVQLRYGMNPPQLHFSPGQTMNLRCEFSIGGAIADSAVNITWFKNGQPLNVSAASDGNPKDLVLSPGKNTSLAGWYGCTVGTKHGAFKLPDFPIAYEVMSRPRLMLHHGASVLNVEGSVVVLECRVDQLWTPHLVPTFTWRRNGVVLDTKNRNLSCWKKSASNSSGFVGNELRLPGISSCLYIWSFSPKKHAGKYTCEVVRTPQKKTSEPLTLALGVPVQCPFPPSSDRHEFVDVSDRVNKMMLLCAANGVLFENQTEWVDSFGNKISEHHHPLLLAMPLSDSWDVVKCVTRSPASQVVKTVVFRRFPTMWNIMSCDQRDQEALSYRSNDSLYLSCEHRKYCMGNTKALPAYDVAWFLNGRRLKSDAAHGVVANGSVLRIARLERHRHSGFFQCRVRSALIVNGKTDERWRNFLVLVSKPALPRSVLVAVNTTTQNSVRLHVRLDTLRLPLCGLLSCELKEGGVKFPVYRAVDVGKIDSGPMMVEINFRNLYAFRSYVGVCQYIDINGINITTRSSNFSFRTLEGRPSKQPKFEISQELPGGFQISWKPLEKKFALGKIIRHRVQWRLITEETFQAREVPVNQYSLRLTGLLGNALYEVSVSSATSVGYPVLFGLVPRVLLIGHTVPLDSRTLVPRCTIIERVKGGTVNEMVKDNSVVAKRQVLTLTWTVKPKPRFVGTAVNQWNLTLLFSNGKRAQSFLLPSAITAKNVSWPPEPYERRALVWLEALDVFNNLLDDAVIFVSNYPPDSSNQPAILPPVNVSVVCLPSDYGLLVRWRDQPLNTLCVNDDTRHNSCYVRIRLTPLPFHVHRQRLYIQLSPYRNATAVEQGVYHVTGLRPDTLYAVGVAFMRLPHLVSDFAIPRDAAACRVQPLPLPIPNVTRVQRLDAQRVYVRIVLPHETGTRLPVSQSVQAVSSRAIGANSKASGSSSASSSLSRIKVVALRFCDASQRPFPQPSPFFLSPEQALEGHVVKIRYPLANSTKAGCRQRGLVRDSITFVQAAFCYERDRCTLWSDYVRVRPEPRHSTSTDVPVDPADYNGDVALGGRWWFLLALAVTVAVAAAAFLVIAVLTVRLTRIRRQLRLRARAGIDIANSSQPEEAAESQPFVPPPQNLPRTKL